MPWWFVTGLHGPASSSTVAQLLGFFTKAALVVFGSGLAVVPFLHGGVVREYGWLTEQQFLECGRGLDDYPGPVVITVAFIGYLVAGPAGGLVAAVGIFLPTYLAVVLVASWFRGVMASRRLRAAVDGVTAAATGAIAGAVVVLGRRALIDVPTWVIALTTLVVLTRMRRVPERCSLSAPAWSGSSSCGFAETVCLTRAAGMKSFWGCLWPIARLPIAA